MELGRSSGLLLHITSLPTPFGIGDLGPSAYRFADALAKARQRWWQVLPIGPTGFGYSPYSGRSTFAGTSLMISPELLASDGLLSRSDLQDAPAFPDDLVDYSRAVAWKSRLLARAFTRFKSRTRPADYDDYCKAQSYWLDHYASFSALRQHYGDAWPNWPSKHRSDMTRALKFARNKLSARWEAVRFEQYAFEKQWQRLRAYCHQHGIRILGDMPIYVAHDSADVWGTQHQFFLDGAGYPTRVGGVPPDFFSETGQRWGNPLYRWDDMAQDDFAWWRDRFRRTCALFDAIRLDHFRGFESYWSIPASSTTAIKGRWVRGPGKALFNSLASVHEALPIIAEDLGVITDEVRALMDAFAIPGMSVLQFAFDSGDANPYLPHNCREYQVAYTGTHDNDTFMGWLSSAPPQQRRFAAQRLNLVPGQEHWNAIRALMRSRAGLVMTPVQDVLGLDTHARMNTPGTIGNNWQWRMQVHDFDALQGAVGERLAHYTKRHGRAPAGVDLPTRPA